MRKDFVQKLKKLPNPFSRIIQAHRQLCLWAGILLLSCGMVWGQVRTPARWQFSVVEDNGVVGETVTLEFKVTLDNTWYIYSTDQDPEVGPLPAEIIFEPHESYVLLGEAIPVKVKQKYDEVWLDSIRIIAESGGGFLQKVKILSPNPVIRSSITYSVCSMETGLCIFPEEDFEFSGIKVRSAGTAPIGEDPNRGGDQAPQVVPPVGDDANSSQPDETLRQGSGAGNPGGQAGFQIEEKHSGGLGGLVRVSTNQGDKIETFPAKKSSGVQGVVLSKKPKKYGPVPSQTHVEKEILSLNFHDPGLLLQGYFL